MEPQGNSLVRWVDKVFAAGESFARPSNLIPSHFNGYRIVGTFHSLSATCLPDLETQEKNLRFDEGNRNLESPLTFESLCANEIINASSSMRTLLESTGEQSCGELDGVPRLVMSLQW